MSFIYRLEQRSIAGSLTSDYNASNREFRPEDVRSFLLTDGDKPILVPEDTGKPVGLLPDSYANSYNNVYATPTAIHHDGLRLDDEDEAGKATVTLPFDHEAVQLYLQDPGALSMTVSILAMAVNTNPVTAPQWPKFPTQIFIGFVSSFRFDEHRCILQLETIESLFSRKSLGAAHPRACRHAIFDSRTCRLRENLFRVDGTVSSVSSDGLTVVVSGANARPDGWFNRGRVHFGAVYRSNSPHGGSAQAYGVWGGILRDIISHSGNTLTLAAPLPPGTYTSGNLQKATMFPGCSGTVPECRDKFNNLNNFGGYPLIPLRDPNKTPISDQSTANETDPRVSEIAEELFGTGGDGGTPGDLFG